MSEKVSPQTEHGIDLYLWRFRFGAGWHDSQCAVSFCLDMHGEGISLRLEFIHLFLQTDLYLADWEDD